ncbi:MAG: cupin domain-containing protein [Gammaproteobacteria bacterium]
MNVNHNAALEVHHLPGLEHRTLAGARDGLQGFEVWRQTITAHAATPVHRHDCEEVIVIFSGTGVCHCEGREFHFKADDTLVIPANVVHQICNTGDTALEIMATLAMSPVKVETADGAPLPLPWDHHPA